LYAVIRQFIQQHSKIYMYLQWIQPNEGVVVTVDRELSPDDFSWGQAEPFPQPIELIQAVLDIAVDHLSHSSESAYSSSSWDEELIKPIRADVANLGGTHPSVLPSFKTTFGSEAAPASAPAAPIIPIAAASSSRPFYLSDFKSSATFAVGQVTSTASTVATATTPDHLSAAATLLSLCAR